MSDKKSDVKWTEEDVPLSGMIKGATLICEKALKLCEGHSHRPEVDRLVDDLQLRWKLVIDFYASLLLAMYLRDDHDHRDLDSSVLQYLNQDIFSPNDLLDLCSALAKYLKEDRSGAWDYRLLDIEFEEFKLISSGRTGNVVQGLLRNILARLGSFSSACSFLTSKECRIIVKNKAISFYSEDGSSSRISVKVCRLKIGDKRHLELFPLILKRQDKQATCWLSLSRTDWVDRTAVEYVDFSTGSHSIGISVPRLVQNVFQLKNRVSENPIYHDGIILENSNIKVNFYGGNIFDLNRVAKDRKNGAALVLVPDVNPANKTAICQQFETLSGISTRGNLPDKMEIGEVYDFDDCDSYNNDGKLDFKPVLFVPLFDINENQPQELENIKKAINNILKYFVDRESLSKVTLVVPALGGFRGHDMNLKVACYWASQLSLQKYEGHIQGGVIFALLDDRSLHTYSRAFLGSEKLLRLESEIVMMEQRKRRLNDELKAAEADFAKEKDQPSKPHFYDAYPYPLVRLMALIDSSSSVAKKRSLLMNTVGFIYSFVTSIALNDLNQMKPDQVAALTAEQRAAAAELICLIGNMWEHGKSQITEGKWCRWAGLSFKCSPILNIMLATVKDVESRRLILGFFKISGTDDFPFDFPALRNANAHDGSISPDCDIDVKSVKDHCDGLKKIVKALVFAKREFMEIVWVESYEKNRNTGEISVTWRGMTGLASIFLPQDEEYQVDEPYSRLDQNRVHLWWGLHNKDPEKVIGLDPFIQYKLCNTCGRNRVYIWGGCKKQWFIYKSIGCNCKLNDTFNEMQEKSAKTFGSIYDNLKTLFENEIASFMSSMA